MNTAAVTEEVITEVTSTFLSEPSNRFLIFPSRPRMTPAISQILAMIHPPMSREGGARPSARGV